MKRSFIIIPSFAPLAMKAQRDTDIFPVPAGEMELNPDLSEKSSVS